MKEKREQRTTYLVKRNGIHYGAQAASGAINSTHTLLLPLYYTIVIVTLVGTRQSSSSTCVRDSPPRGGMMMMRTKKTVMRMGKKQQRAPRRRDAPACQPGLAHTEGLSLRNVHTAPHTHTHSTAPNSGKKRINRKKKTTSRRATEAPPIFGRSVLCFFSTRVR